MHKPSIPRALARTATAAALAGAVMVLTLGGTPAFATNTASSISAQSASVTRSQAAAMPAPPSRPASTPYVPHSGRPRPAATNYVVTVHTGDVAGAGTDGNVWVWFDGTAGRSGWLALDNGQDNFERNATDYFTFTLRDLGTPVNCWVYFQPAGLFPDWYLDTVTINGKAFSYYGWLTRKGTVRLNPT